MESSHLEPSGSASSAPSRKQRAITLGVKKQVIDTLASQNMSRTEVAKKFGIPRTTLKSILSQKEKIIRAMDEGADGKRIRLKNIERSFGSTTNDMLSLVELEIRSRVDSSADRSERFNEDSVPGSSTDAVLSGLLSQFLPEIQQKIKEELDDPHPMFQGMDIPMPQVEKRRAVTLDVKKDVIEAASKNLSKRELERQFNLTRRTIKRILDHKDTILKAIDDGVDVKRARLKQGKYVDVENALICWVKLSKSQDIHVNGPMLKISMETKSKKTRRVLCLQDKKEVLDAYEKEKSWVKLSKQFNGLPSSTIKTIVSNKRKILNALDQGGQAKRSRIYPVKHEEIETGVISWIKSRKSQNIEISGPLIREKAKELAGHFNIEGFQASSGWLENFKKRYSSDLLGKPKRKSSNVGSNESLNQTFNNTLTRLSTKPEPELTHVDGMNPFYQNIDARIKVENDDELLDFYEDSRDLTTTNGVLRMVELAEERARAMAGSSAMEDDSLMESSFNGEDCGPDRLAFDQECSTSNESVEVKSEINEDEPTRSGDVTIKDAQSAFKVVRKFIEAKFDAPTVLRMCKDLDAVLANDT
ncbi:tc5 transposase DNA-binding domain-containing protein [Ditylenchus destructor]|nr:tc5 transposase DNA-binding domain-containing protein [Ditylenchus destructor]